MSAVLMRLEDMHCEDCGAHVAVDLPGAMTPAEFELAIVAAADAHRAACPSPKPPRERRDG